jgi:hypothetical protein
MKIYPLAGLLVFFLSFQNGKKIQNGNSLPANLNTTAVTNSSNILNNSEYIKYIYRSTNENGMKIDTLFSRSLIFLWLFPVLS